MKNEEISLLMINMINETKKARLGLNHYYIYKDRK